MKITITRALNELKLLDKRINHSILDLKLTDIVSKKYPDKVSSKNNYAKKEDFIKVAKADYQSVNDLINRRDKIKAEINKSNALTSVTINGSEMSVSEAIEKKNSIKYKNTLLKVVTDENATAVRQKEQLDREVQTGLDRLIDTTFGRDKKTDSAEVKTLTESYLSMNGFEIVDPVDTNSVMKKLKEDIDGFLSDVDIALTESNSRTEIEI